MRKFETLVFETFVGNKISNSTFNISQHKEVGLDLGLNAWRKLTLNALRSNQLISFCKYIFLKLSKFYLIANIRSEESLKSQKFNGLIAIALVLAY